ncbi:hypothetical protein F5050DRAFT_1714336 [Lentinula boryana]|uniref:Uncharacterized protein n=1 Tax=Lentinula boryana TaxID=40481 RepID=A0ABQ8Q591_9AGAR|nr:hypothetical protein F5050DRAFT_1714336 [Lentinula boryana]
MVAKLQPKPHLYRLDFPYFSLNDLPITDFSFCAIFLYLFRRTTIRFNAVLHFFAVLLASGVCALPISTASYSAQNCSDLTWFFPDGTPDAIMKVFEAKTGWKWGKANRLNLRLTNDDNVEVNQVMRDGIIFYVEEMPDVTKMCKVNNVEKAVITPMVNNAKLIQSMECVQGD